MQDINLSAFRKDNINFQMIKDREIIIVHLLSEMAKCKAGLDSVS